MIIAIDGPAGSGKSTVAKLVAQKLGFTFLNSGSFYRAVTLALLRAEKIGCSDASVCDLAKSLDISYRIADAHLILNGEDIEHLLHSDTVDAHVARVSSIVPLRRIVNDKLQYIGRSMSIVCEGRDMTTVVFPNADFKFYLDASIEIQALRRFNQGVSGLTLEQVRESIKERDEIDKNKKEGALKISPDAVYIDTSDLTIQHVCEIIINKIHI